ncbi:cell filamentation protein Fic [Streptomyces eurocidicus]|uniref:Cell filamentation protein Fic n=1 Tax=Streptomyces eurocidicus TaxID=66423 RepID=A0A2N8NQS6_STREU|nr:Fic family protein [Streptomyces eurocidicus]MBB5116877.1 Fic family protein [Streptomyces eurocidicus]MBF6052817.1 Fic family protein [Streptomyces eurocidicus]PNE31122.1 cell filamentation protein Fic [Streptomyces eurocidicus]
MLYETPRLEPVDLEVLEQVNAMRDQLRFAVQQVPMKWTLDLRKALTASAIAASNTIEGYRVDAKDVADLMDGEREVEASEENKAETLAYQQAMTYIQSLHDVADFRYNKELLNSLHWMLQGHHHPLKTAGQWRRTSIRITAPGDELATDYEGPDQELVPGLMSEFVDWLNEGDLDHHVLVRAAMAHLNLVKIHPWSDGNGRMSRSLQTLLIARGGVLAPEFSSIEEWLGMPGNTWEYYKVLREVGGPVWSPQRDTLPWIKFNLLAYHQQAQRVQRRVDRSNECWMQLMDAAEAGGITERQVTALHEVAMTGRVRRSRYEKAEGLNTQQATRDMQALARAELLTAVGQTKGRYYVAGPAFPSNVLATAQRPHTIINPYAA